MTRSGRQLISLAIIVIGASVSVCSAQASSPASGSPSNTTAAVNASPPVQSPADASEQVQKATDDVNQVEAAVADAARLLNDADKYQKTIATITIPTAKSTQPALDDLQQLEATVEAVSRSKLIEKLTDAKNALDQSSSGSAENTRNQDCGSVSQPSTGQQQDVTDALAKCSKAAKDASVKSLALGTALTNLQEKLQTISPYVGDQVTGLQNKLKPFSDSQLTSSSPDVSTILQILPTGLSTLKQVLQSKDQYQTTWNSAKAALGQLSIAAASKNASGQAAVDPDKAFGDLQTTVDGIVPNLDTWFKAIAGELQSSAKSLDGMIADVASDPAKNSANALGTVRTKSDEISSAQSVVDAWPPLVGFLVDRQPDSFSLKTTRADLQDLQKWLNVARGSLSRVHDALAGDFNGFETDQVSLYYFTDVSRLMYVLNEGFQTMGGVAEAKAQADAQRTTLIQTELELADAQATVNRYQKQVLDLQEQQRQAQAKLKGLNASVSKLGNRLNNAQDAKNQADADYKQAQSDQANAPNDPTQTTAVNKAAAKQTAAATKLSQTQSDYDAAKSDQDKAQSQLDNTQNQSDSLPAKMAAAQQSLSDAQTAVSQERRKTLLAAQAESDAFAFARDNTPFMVAPADASSPNPAKRVMLYAFNDSKTIFMRGKRSDVDEVKRIIAAFDQPAPQARLTLWTFELSAEAGQKANKNAANKLNRSMEIIDEQLGSTRALENTTLTLLRDIVNEEVQIKSKPFPPDSLARCKRCTNADKNKLSRLPFYDPLVLDQLGFSMEVVDVKRLRGEIPDPAGTTTLGEALLIVSLAPLETRKEVRKKLEERLRSRLAALPLSPKLDTCAWSEEVPDHPCPDDVARPTKDAANANSQYLLPLTWHALGIWEEGSATGLTSAQLEITRALRTTYDNSGLPKIAEKLAGWTRELPELTSQLDQVKHDMAAMEDKAMKGLKPPDKDRLRGLLQQSDSTQPNTDRTKLVLQGLSPADQQTYGQQHSTLLNITARQRTVEHDSIDVINDLQAQGFDVGDLVSLTAALPGSTGAAAAQRVMKALSQVISAATPREAAADEMLKEMIIAIEDDLDRLFIQPMIRGLRKRLIEDGGVRVGILQRESMLATNRGKARVDPRASAQLAVGEEQDILAGVQQLAQLYGAVQSGGALAALGALQQQPREPQPEIYALTTGNKFEVTPIFDPSGQALRFKFDFVGASKVQEPNGSTDPQFPRIERHTVNTEVQLSNLETREISRFESDARLGLPTRYSGGFPILKDIPYVRPWVPLIGWFVRKAGSNAVAQQSVIFGQTTIYPSIQTMVSLLEDSESSQSANPSATGTSALPQSAAQPQPSQPVAAPPQ